MKPERQTLKGKKKHRKKDNFSLPISLKVAQIGMLDTDMSLLVTAGISCMKEVTGWCILYERSY
jgi:hypothetical protein